MSPHSDTPSPNLHARLRDVADAMRAQAAVAVPKQANVHLAWAVVNAINVGPPPTIDIVPGGVSGGSVWSQVSYEGWYNPTVGDSVLVMIDGTDRIVIGTMGSGSGYDKTWAIVGVAVYTYPGFTALVAGVINELWSVTSSGSIAFEIFQNGSSVIGPITANTTHTPSSFSPVTVVAGDYFELHVTVISGTPDVSVTLV